MAGSARQGPIGQGGLPTRLPRRRWLWCLLLAAVACWPAHALAAKKLDELDLDRWAKLREVERYQMQIAEKSFREQSWKVAAAEYEKYLTLYQQSEGAPYAQLKWGLCQVRLRQANTAIKDGFQSVRDYWPESPDAIAAAYYIGDTYKGIGQTAKAKKAFQALIEAHPTHLAAACALSASAEIAVDENDRDGLAVQLKKLTFDIKRTKETEPLCAQAARSYAALCFSLVAFDEGVKALATTYPEAEVPGKVYEYLREPLARLAGKADTQPKAEKLLASAVGYLREKTPTNTTQPEQKAAAKKLWFAIADLRAAGGQQAKVAETYDQIIKLFGSDDEILGHLAAWLESAARQDEARKTYRRFADKVAGVNQVALSYRRQGQCEGAVSAYKELLELDADNRIRWKGEIGDTYAEARKWKEAIIVYAELVNEDAKRPDSWRFKMATAYKHSGQYKEAIAHFRQCDNFPANYWEMGSCHRALKQYDEALMLYRQIVGGAPQQGARAMLEIGYTLEEADRRERAIKALQEVCKQYPRDPSASRAHAHLQNKYKISVTLGGDIEK